MIKKWHKGADGDGERHDEGNDANPNRRDALWIQDSTASRVTETVISGDVTTPQNVIMSEEERKELANSITALVWLEYAELAYVLSFCPEATRLFIEGQKYAQEKTGRKVVHYTIYHTKDEYGLWEESYYYNWHSEYLANTGRWIIEIIGTIKYLRDREHPVISSFENMDDFAEIISGSGDNESIHAKVIEAMNLTGVERDFIVKIAQQNRRIKELREEAGEMKKEAERLLGQAWDIFWELKNELKTLYGKE